MNKITVAIAVLTMLVSCGGRGATKKDKLSVGKTEVAAAEAVPAVKPVRYSYKVLETMPHDREAYTQGLIWLDGFLYEGTGQNGESELRQVEPKSGRVLKSVKLPDRYFGEGITFLDGRIYQLTWTEGRAIVYDASDFRQVRSFSYDGEGWGLTTDGKKLYMSDGSENIYVRNPETFAVEQTFEVRRDGMSIDMLNELEWIDGRIWANRYLTEEVVIIDPATGNVVAEIDFTGIQSPADRLPGTDVFNGIAYDSVKGDIYVTGKHWNKMYRVEVAEVE